MNILIMGGPGSGKTTQAKLLSEKLGLDLISSGEIAREIADEDSPDGHLAKEKIDAGLLIPDDLLFSRLTSKIKKGIAKGGFVMDGYPRDENELSLLSDFLINQNSQVDKVFFIELSDDEATKRILHRAQTENRSDDTAETIKERLAVYHSQTEPVLNQFRIDGKLKQVDGTGSIEQINNELI